MWKKFIDFMTGPFAGQSKLWAVIEEKLAESAFERRINDMIIVGMTHPDATELMRMFSGNIINNKKAMKHHALPIGNHVWIGKQISMDGSDGCNIFLCEDPEADVTSATLVYWDGVKIKGSWLDDIERSLADFSAHTRQQVLKRVHEKSLLDHNRANGQYSV